MVSTVAVRASLDNGAGCDTSIGKLHVATASHRASAIIQIIFVLLGILSSRVFVLASYKSILQ